MKLLICNGIDFRLLPSLHLTRPRLAAVSFLPRKLLTHCVGLPEGIVWGEGGSIHGRVSPWLAKGRDVSSSAEIV
jgi:hypothetical protein